MDRPAVDKVEGVPPAIAIDQTNPVRSSRSTVGTMTELNDHLKLLFARAAELFDKADGAARAPRLARDDLRRPDAAHRSREARGDEPRLIVTFPVELPADTSAEEIEQWLAASGFTRVHAEREVASPTGPRKVLDVVADRFRVQATEKVRVVEAIETALKRGGGPGQRLRRRRAANEDGDPLRPSSGAIRPACTAPRAIAATPIRSRRCSRSTRPTARARPAAASAA